MSVQILRNADDTQAALYCGTSDWAFGPVFREYREDWPSGERLDASEVALEFIQWLPMDARQYEAGDLEAKYHEFLAALPGLLRARREAEEAEAEEAVRCRTCA